MMKSICCFLAVFWCCLGVMAQGQDTSRYVCLTLQSGMVRCGQLVADDGREVTLQTPDMGKLVLPKVQVVRMVDAVAGTKGSAGSSAIAAWQWRSLPRLTWGKMDHPIFP